MIGTVRPGPVDLPLFLHVAGAMTLFGAIGATFALCLAGLRRPDAAVLARSAFLSVVVAGVPAWVLMRVGAQWAYSKEQFFKGQHWISIGFAVSDAGLVLLLLLAGATYLWTHRLDRSAPRAALLLAGAYLAALAVAWLAMTGKWS